MTPGRVSRPRAAAAISAAALALAAACAGRPAPADLLLTHARVYSLAWGEPGRDGAPAADAPHDSAGWHPDAEAVAVRGDRIVFVGSLRDAERFRGPATKTIDLAGATLVPGLVDSHTHVAELGSNLARVNLVGVTTEAEAVERVAARARSVPKGQWVLGYGWDEGAWATHYPTMALLSDKIPDHPVFLRSLHGFAAWGNRLAFERAGITGSTAAPVGGTIVRRGGTPTGVLLNRATVLLEEAIPAPTTAQLADRIAAALDSMAARGYVAVHEAGADLPTMAAFAALDSAGRLPIRVDAMLSVRDTALVRDWLGRGPRRDTTARLRAYAVKAYYDGALGSRGARLLADYADSAGHRGVSGAGYGFDRALVARLMARGWQLAVHAIGDAGNREVLDFVDSVYRADPAARANRNRVEHAQVIHPDDVARFASLGLIASMEPPHAVEDKTWAEARLGPERVKGAYAWRTLRAAGVPLMFNSDLPGSNWDFFYGFHSAVTRTDPAGQPPGGWYPAQRMTPEEALRGYTVWNAFGAGLERSTGVIAPGRWADLTAVDSDVLNLGERDPHAVLRGRVVLTVVAGRVVFSR